MRALLILFLGLGVMACEETKGDDSGAAADSGSGAGDDSDDNDGPGTSFGG